MCNSRLIPFETVVKDILNEYLHSLNIGEEQDIQFVCQKCTDRPASSSIEILTQHLQSCHISHINETNIEQFIKDFITFEEPLTLDLEREDDSDNEVTVNVVLPNFHCPLCQNVFSSTKRLIFHLSQHVELNVDNGVICCDNFYNDKISFVNHLQNDHESDENIENTCKTCGFVGESLKELQCHITATHNIGKKRVKKKHSPNDQKYIPVNCPECNKSFSNKYHMRFHLKSHTGTSKFFCDQCEKSYSNQGNLRHHKKLVHQGLFEFTCTSCGETFPTRQARDTHALLHTGSKPFSCKYCSKSFRSKHSLNCHIETHLDIRKYGCHICPKRFRKNSHLKYHLSTHEK